MSYRNEFLKTELLVKRVLNTPLLRGHFGHETKLPSWNMVLLRLTDTHWEDKKLFPHFQVRHFSLPASTETGVLFCLTWSFSLISDITVLSLLVGLKINNFFRFIHRKFISFYTVPCLLSSWSILSFKIPLTRAFLGKIY